MKKYFVMLVMFVCVAMTSKAQYVYKTDPVSITMNNGYRYAIEDIPGGAWMCAGDNVMTCVNNYFIKLSHDNPAAYQREFNAWTMRGGFAGLKPIEINAMNGAMMVGGGAMMVGSNQNTGMIYSQNGVIPVQSNVVVNNNNMASKMGTNTYTHIGINGEGKLEASISGDLLSGALRFGQELFGSKKNKSFQNGQILQDANGNRYIINNGVLVPVQTQQVQTRTAQPVQQQVTYQQTQTRTVQQQPVQQTNYGGGVATSTVYNVASGF